MRFLAAQESSEAEISATLTHSSGAKSALPVCPVPSAELPGAKAGWLKPEEVDLFRYAVQEKPFTCLICGRTCRWETLRCRGEGGFGHLVYPSLEERQSAGFVLFQRQNESVSFQIQGCGVVRLDGETVAVKAEGKRPAIYRYETTRGRWMETEEDLKPYHPAGEGTYAVLV